ncbi:acyl carrier protein [Novosphingobium clariflavum]|uniref:Acyl carrier protein n=1 Tax=Novosphingobium clariflavum TaxID=2029884 RepID=A0ABV6S610_9SPHN|nr:hypothetical protein [Novosphingobium clariflavum]
MTPPPSPETVDRVTGVLALFVDADQIDPRAFLVGDLALSWRDRLCLCSELEETFQIDIPDQVLTDWETVEDIASTVSEIERKARR